MRDGEIVMAILLGLLIGLVLFVRHDLAFEIGQKHGRIDHQISILQDMVKERCGE